MKTQTIYVDACTSTGIAIGRRNTYATEQIVFGLAQLVQQYGAGSAVLMVLRPTDTTPYPAVTSQSGTELTWTVSATDTSIPGTGECELYWYVDGGLAKSVIFPLTIQRDIITEPIDEPPEPYQTWVDDLTDLGAETLQNAQAAAQSATDAETAQGLAEDAKTAAETAQGKAETAQGKAETAQEKAETAQTAAEAAADRAEDALEEFTTPTASATTLAPTAPATASYANGHFTFGIPQGVPGDPGDPGVTPDFSIGTVQTLQPTEQATASITGTAEHPVLNLGIPQGVQGDPATNLVQSVNGKTGAVVLDAGDIGYDGETTYPDASVGAELTTINSALSSLSSVTEIIDTASGAIASFPDGSGLPMRSLVAEINPVQDLHGQSSPYPAGGGANKLNNAKAGTSETIGTYTFASNADGSVVCSGTGSATANFFLNETLTLSAGTYTMCILDAVVTTGTVRLYLYNNATQTVVSQISISTANASNTFTLAEDATLWCYVNVASSGATFNGKTLYPMIVVGSTAPTAWTPYSNECPISGWTGLSGQRTGANVWDEEWEVGTISWSGNNYDYDTTRIRSKNYIQCKPSTAYYVKTVENGNLQFFYYDSEKNFISYEPSSAINRAITTPSNARYMRFYVYSAAYGNVYNHDISINYPSTDTFYHAYTDEPISVTFPSTVYGGTDEVISGNGTSTMGMVDFSDLSWSLASATYGRWYAVIDGIKPSADGATPLNAIAEEYKIVTSNAYNNVVGTMYGVPNGTTINVCNGSATDKPKGKLVYELATPTTFTHEGQSVDTLVGQNNVWVDTGDVSVTYQASIKGYIDKVLAS